MTKLQIAILKTLFFPEAFDSICEEVATTPAILADELKQFIDKRWVSVMRYDTKLGDYKTTLYYDSDNMMTHYFQITSVGLNVLEEVKNEQKS